MRLRRHVGARSLLTGLTLGAGVAFAVTVAGSLAAAQELEWATRAGGSDSDQGLNIATDGPGNSYVTGTFSGTATFGEDEANETELSAAGGFDIFVAKYDRHGQLLWATRAGGIGRDDGNGIATNSHGDSYVTGIFSGTAIFGEGEENETELTAAGSFRREVRT